MKPVGSFSKAKIATSFANAGQNAIKVSGSVAWIGQPKPTKRGKTKSPICKRKQK